MRNGNLTIVVADLGSTEVAAFIAQFDGVPVAVVNRVAEYDAAVREQAVYALAAAGFGAEKIRWALGGVVHLTADTEASR